MSFFDPAICEHLAGPKPHKTKKRPLGGGFEPNHPECPAYSPKGDLMPHCKDSDIRHKELL